MPGRGGASQWCQGECGTCDVGNPDITHQLGSTWGLHPVSGRNMFKYEETKL